MAMKRFKVLNYALNEKTQLPSTESVPTLVPSDKMREILGNDDRPYFKIQAIDYPIKGTGGIYEEPFFESFLNVTKDRPIPGSKRGHWRGNRPESDFYMVGGDLKKNGDGTGTVFFKNYIPPKGDGTDNERFIQDCKAGIVHFSLVTMPSYTVDENGLYHFTGTQGYERNDAVEFGTGAMRQQTNSEQGESVANLKRLIESGKVDKTSPWSFTAADGDKLLGENGDDWDTYSLWHLYENEDEAENTKARYSYPYGKGGKVYRSALRSIASRAAQQGLDDLSNLASEMLTLMDSKGENMNKEEMLAKLANMKANGELTNVELAKTFGLKLENAEELTALKKENSDLKAKVAETETVRVNAFLDKEFGATGLLRDYAGKMLNSLDAAKVEEFKKDPVALQLAGNQADITIGKVEENSKKPATKTVGGVTVVEV